VGAGADGVGAGGDLGDWRLLFLILSVLRFRLQIEFEPEVVVDKSPSDLEVENV
jgi:hypothetical protein